MKQTGYDLIVGKEELGGGRKLAFFFLVKGLGCVWPLVVVVGGTVFVGGRVVGERDELLDDGVVGVWEVDVVDVVEGEARHGRCGGVGFGLGRWCCRGGDEGIAAEVGEAERCLELVDELDEEKKALCAVAMSCIVFEVVAERGGLYAEDAVGEVDDEEDVVDGDERQEGDEAGDGDGREVRYC